MPDDSRIPTATFTVEVPAAGEQAFVHAVVHRGGVRWIGETTNPNFGGTHGIGEQTIDEFLRDGPLGGLTREEAEPIFRHIATHRRSGEGAPDPNPLNAHGVTPLHERAGDGDLAGVRALLAAGADPDARSLGRGTPLHEACERIHVEVVDALLAAGADAGALNAHAQSPIARVIEAGRMPPTPADDADRQRIVRALLAHGAPVGDRDVWRAAAWTRPGILADLLGAGGEAAPAREHDVPIVAGGGSVEILAILVGAGAYVKTRDGFGRTAVHAALDSADLGALRYLAERGALAALTDDQRASLLADTRRWKRDDLTAVLEGR